MQGYYYEEHYRELYDNEKPLQLVLFWAKNGLMKRLYLIYLRFVPCKIFMVHDLHLDNLDENCVCWTTILRRRRQMHLRVWTRGSWATSWPPSTWRRRGRWGRSRRNISGSSTFTAEPWHSSALRITAVVQISPGQNIINQRYRDHY